MLMSIKVKEVAVFPVIEILSRIQADEKHVHSPERYWIHLNLLLTGRRIGRNMLMEFIDSELTPAGVTWVAEQLIVEDKKFEKALKSVGRKAANAESKLEGRG